MDPEEEFWETRRQTIATPFRYFATQEADDATLAPFSFPRIFYLPPKVLGLVFKACDASVLFQLMRSCRFIRSLTWKPFWSDLTIWYQIPETWWRSRNCNHLLSCRLDMEFARHVKQIEIRLGRMEWEFTPSNDLEEKIASFWRAVQHSFPLAHHIVLATIGFWGHSPSFSGEDHNAYAVSIRLLRQAPRGLSVFISCEDVGSQMEPRLWMLDISRTPQLQQSQMPWLPKRVAPPSRHLSEGPLRDYEFMCKVPWFPSA